MHLDHIFSAFIGLAQVEQKCWDLSQQYQKSRAILEYFGVFIPCYLPSPESPAHERGFCCPLSHVQPHSQGAQGCPCRVFTGMCSGAAACSSVPPVPSRWGCREEPGEQSRAHTHPLRAPHHRKTPGLHLHTTC